MRAVTQKNMIKIQRRERSETRTAVRLLCGAGTVSNWVSVDPALLDLEILPVMTQSTPTRVPRNSAVQNSTMFDKQCFFGWWKGMRNAHDKEHPAPGTPPCRVRSSEHSSNLVFSPGAPARSGFSRSKICAVLYTYVHLSACFGISSLSLSVSSLLVIFTQESFVPTSTMLLLPSTLFNTTRPSWTRRLYPGGKACADA